MNRRPISFGILLGSVTGLFAVAWAYPGCSACPAVQVGSPALPAVQIGPTSGPAVIVQPGAVSAPIQIGPTTRPMVLVVTKATVNVSAWAAVAGIVGGVALAVLVVGLLVHHKLLVRRMRLCRTS
jgi:membrane associated rhomboid family serine protease